MKIKSLMLGLTAALIMAGCETTASDPAPNDRNNQATGEMCGGIAGFTCGMPNDFCKTEISAQCGAADQSGVCTPKPEICTTELLEVCGCDGQTYGNACVAAAQGVSVASEGACPS